MRQFIDDASIDHAPEFPTKEQLSSENFSKESFLLHTVHYAKVCSVAMKSLYCFPTIRPRSDVAELAQHAQALLDEWQHSLPKHFSVLQQGSKLPTDRHSSQAYHMVDFSMKYYEAVLVFHQRCVGFYIYIMSSIFKNTNSFRGEICVQSARTILSLTHLLECDQSHLKWCAQPSVNYSHALFLILHCTI
jgi:hypothetical protein